MTYNEEVQDLADTLETEAVGYAGSMVGTMADLEKAIERTSLIVRESSQTEDGINVQGVSEMLEQIERLTPRLRGYLVAYGTLQDAIRRMREAADDVDK